MCESVSHEIPPLSLSIDCRDKTVREINRLLRSAVAEGAREVRVAHPRRNRAARRGIPGQLATEGYW